MTQTEAINFIHEFYFAVWGQLNPEKLEHYYSKTVTAFSGNTSFGYDEILKHLTNLKKIYTHIVPNFHNIIVLDNRIMVWVTQNAMAIKDENLSLESMITYEVDNGKIINLWFMWDKPIEKVFHGFDDTPTLTESSDSIQNILSRRELECFFYTIHGKTAKQIAQILEISNRTVEDYLRRIRDKLHLETSQDMMNYAVNRGFIRVDNALSQLIQTNRNN